MNWKILRAAVALAAFFAAAPAQAQAPPAEQKADVALALVLAVDASGSVDNRRFELQKQGYAAAFRSPKVLNSIRSLMTQSIAVTMVQWTGPRLHVVVVDWMLVKDETSVTALASGDRSRRRGNCSAAAPRSPAPSTMRGFSSHNARGTPRGG